jgi:hypothetical protein
LRSHFDHASEADDYQSLDQYVIAFTLELAGSFMFPDRSGDYVPAYLLPIDGKYYKTIFH